MAKKNTTSAPVTASDVPAETPVVETPKTIKTTVMIDGVLLEIPVESATSLLDTLKDSPEVKAQKEAARKAALAQKLKDKRDAEKAKLAQDPEWIAKQQARETAKAAKAAIDVRRAEGRARRQAKNDAEKTERETILKDSGSVLPADRLKVAKLVKKFNHGEKGNDAAHRGWEAKLVYTNIRGMEVKLNHVVDLDVDGVGTLQTAYDKAHAALLEMLADAK
jgi:hypothetical protein